MARVNDENFWYCGDSLKNLIFKGVHKKPIYSRELTKWGGGAGAVNAYNELTSLADSYASLSCFSKSHSDYTTKISSALLPRKHM